jgi:pyruvate kinase
MIDIVCTLGPASSKPEVIRQLLEQGMTVARVNLSHSDQRTHRDVIHTVREVARSIGKHVSILGDLQGPKIRLGEIAGGEADLRIGDEFLLHARPIVGNQHEASVDYPDIVHDVKPGSRILINDGIIELTAKRVAKDFIETQVVIPGKIASHQGVNLPGTPLRLPALTPKDRDDLRFLLLEKVDVIACSFIRQAAHMEEIRSFSGVARGHGPTFIAKIETLEGVHNFSGILQASDGVMVARGDLGVEIPYTWVPLLQKAMIRECNRAGKYVITATHMLQSMVNHPIPTRAEVTDIFQAVLDGSDAVMLSAESAAGQYPVESVNTMAAVVTFAQQVRGDQPFDLADILQLLSGKVPSARNGR